MTPGILFIVIGLLLVFLEFFLPGGIMGAAGGVLVAIGLVVFALNSNSMVLVITVTVATIVAVVLLGYFALRRIKGSKRIYLSQDQSGYRASSWAKEMIGKEGEVLAALRPSGHISIDGKRFQALSRMGYIDQGEKIVVVGGQGAHLVVKRKEL